MLYFDYNEYIKEGICFMLIQDDALRSVIARTLRVKEEELNGSLTLAHSQNSQMSFMYGFFFVKFLFFTVVCVVIVV